MTTLREKLIKIGAKVIGHARYTVFQVAVKSWIACFNCSALRKLAPDKAFRVKMPNQISTWLSQLAEVGVKWLNSNKGTKSLTGL